MALATDTAAVQLCIGLEGGAATLSLMLATSMSTAAMHPNGNLVPIARNSNGRSYLTRSVHVHPVAAAEVVFRDGIEDADPCRRLPCFEPYFLSPLRCPKP